MKHRFLALAAVLAGMSGPALAADFEMPTPDRFGWDGFYAGAQIGYDSTKAESGFFNTSASGAVGGIHAGYLFGFGNVYVGPEVSFDWTGLNASTFHMDHALAARIRAGLAMDRLLFSVSGGISHVGVSSPVFGSFDNTGWLLGAGVDFAVTDHVIVGADYTYHGHDDFDNTGVDVDMNVVRARLSYKF